MYKRFVFLSVSVFAVISASNADVSGYFLPNTVVSNACSELDAWVYDGTVTMVPVYEDTIYNCMHGYYLPRGTEECAPCPANSYCAGGEYTYSDTMDSGISESNPDVSEYFLPNTVVSNACSELDAWVYDGTVTMVPVYEDTIYNCVHGYYLPRGTEECAPCPANSYCAGGEYTYSDTMDSGVASCASGLIAPSGMWQAEQCGHAIHIGDATLYLRQTKQTEHALHVQSGDNIFYGNATTADVPMNENTTHRLKVLYNDVIYSIYDDTVTVEQ